MRNQIYTPEVSAELLLNLLYPALKDKWKVKDKGTFYRNYSHDILAIDTEEHEVSLSRDGFLRLLPPGMISNENELKGDNFEEKYAKLDQRKRTLQEAFVPFDSFIFRRRIHVEHEVQELLNSKIDYLLNTYFGFDREHEDNPYIKTISVILPYISKLRANVHFTKELISTITGCETEMTCGRYSEKDNTHYWLPWVKYDLTMKNLSSQEYKAKSKEIKELELFINEWFMPFDSKCSLRIKHHQQPFVPDGNLTLNYNTEL